MTTAATDEVAVTMSLCVASEPELRPAPVSVRVAAPQMSEAIATPLVSARELYVHTNDGTDNIIEPIDEEAVRTALSVWAFTLVLIPAVAVSVCAFTTAARDEVAVTMSLWVAGAATNINVLSSFTRVPPDPQERNAGQMPTVEAGVNA